MLYEAVFQNTENRNRDMSDSLTYENAAGRKADTENIRTEQHDEINFNT